MKYITIGMFLVVLGGFFFFNPKAMKPKDIRYIKDFVKTEPIKEQVKPEAPKEKKSETAKRHPN